MKNLLNNKSFHLALISFSVGAAQYFVNILALNFLNARLFQEYYFNYNAILLFVNFLPFGIYTLMSANLSRINREGSFLFLAFLYLQVNKVFAFAIVLIVFRDYLNSFMVSILIVDVLFFSTLARLQYNLKEYAFLNFAYVAFIAIIPFFVSLYFSKYMDYFFIVLGVISIILSTHLTRFNILPSFSMKMLYINGFYYVVTSGILSLYTVADKLILIDYLSEEEFSKYAEAFVYLAGIMFLANVTSLIWSTKFAVYLSEGKGFYIISEILKSTSFKISTILFIVIYFVAALIYNDIIGVEPLVPVYVNISFALFVLVFVKLLNPVFIYMGFKRLYVLSLILPVVLFISVIKFVPNQDSIFSSYLYMSCMYLHLVILVVALYYIQFKNKGLV